MGIAPEPRAIVLVYGNTNPPRGRSTPGKIVRLGSWDEIVLEKELRFES